MNSRLLLTAIVFGLGLIIAFVPENTTKPYKLTAGEMLEKLQNGTEMVTPDELADWLVNKDPSIQLIDIRTPKEFEQFHLDDALNIPLSQLLEEEWIDNVDQGIKMNIFYGNGTTLAHEAWMITRQLGYDNNYVLLGGLNYWTETIMNPTAPQSTSADDEIAKYAFRKGAGQFFGSDGSSSQNTDAATQTEKPKIIRKSKKKAPEGGC